MSRKSEKVWNKQRGTASFDDVRAEIEAGRQKKDQDFEAARQRRQQELMEVAAGCKVGVDGRSLPCVKWEKYREWLETNRTQSLDFIADHMSEEVGHPIDAGRMSYVLRYMGIVRSA